MGAMTFAKVMIKNLFEKKVTEDYPNKEKKNYDLTRGHIEINIDNCVLCGLCSRKCPTTAITVNRQEKSWEIDRLRCIQCGYCSENCPKKCLSIKNEYTKPEEGAKNDKYVKEV